MRRVRARYFFSRHASRAAFGLAIAALAGVLACDPPPNAVSNGGGQQAQSPRATIEKLMECGRGGSYVAMESLIVRERAADTIATLSAVNEFISANAQLCDYVRERLGAGLARAADQSQIAAQLDIFSAHVALIDERVDGLNARVTFMIDGKLPVQTAELRKVDGHWRYDPGAGYDPRLPEGFRLMAQGLRQVVADLKAGMLDDAVANSPEKLLEEIRLRLLPGLKTLKRPAESAPRP